MNKTHGSWYFNGMRPELKPIATRFNVMLALYGDEDFRPSDNRLWSLAKKMYPGENDEIKAKRVKIFEKMKVMRDQNRQRRRIKRYNESTKDNKYIFPEQKDLKRLDGNNFQEGYDPTTKKIIYDPAEDFTNIRFQDMDTFNYHPNMVGQFLQNKTYIPERHRSFKNASSNKALRQYQEILDTMRTATRRLPDSFYDYFSGLRNENTRSIAPPDTRSPEVNTTALREYQQEKGEKIDERENIRRNREEARNNFLFNYKNILMEVFGGIIDQTFQDGDYTPDGYFRKTIQILKAPTKYRRAATDIINILDYINQHDMGWSDLNTSVDGSTPSSSSSSSSSSSILRSSSSSSSSRSRHSNNSSSRQPRSLVIPDFRPALDREFSNSITNGPYNNTNINDITPTIREISNVLGSTNRSSTSLSSSTHSSRPPPPTVRSRSRTEEEEEMEEEEDEPEDERTNALNETSERYRTFEDQPSELELNNETIENIEKQSVNKAKESLHRDLNWNARVIVNVNYISDDTYNAIEERFEQAIILLGRVLDNQTTEIFETADLDNQDIQTMINAVTAVYTVIKACKSNNTIPPIFLVTEPFMKKLAEQVNMNAQNLKGDFYQGLTKKQKMLITILDQITDYLPASVFSKSISNASSLINRLYNSIFGTRPQSVSITTRQMANALNYDNIFKKLKAAAKRLESAIVHEMQKPDRRHGSSSFRSHDKSQWLRSQDMSPWLRPKYTTSTLRSKYTTSQSRPQYGISPLRSKHGVVSLKRAKHGISPLCTKEGQQVMKNKQPDLHVIAQYLDSAIKKQIK